MRRWRSLEVVALAAGVLGAQSCATPTSIDIVVYSEVPCEQHAAAVLTLAGALAELPTSAPSSSSTKCEDDGRLGNVVVTPAVAKDGTMAIALMTRPDGLAADRCLDRDAVGCIVAKRRFRFEPHVEARMRVDLRLSCLDVRCRDDETCVRGACVPADIECGPSCDETQLINASTASADAGEDATAESDASRGDDAQVDLDAAPPSPVVTFPGAYDPSPNAVAVGADHGCVILASGQVACWGANDVGQVGDGTTQPRSAPVPVVGLPVGIPAIAVSAGNKFSCALLQSGPVWCWGTNARGQLGDGTTDPSSSTPRLVGPLGNVTLIAAGDAHACGMGEPEATVHCWGANDHGQLGDGTTTDARTPVLAAQLSPGPPASSWVLGAGNAHSCSGTGLNLQCWGDNADGQLGDGSQTMHASPTAVNMGAVNAFAFVAFGAGGASSCLVASPSTDDGNLLACFGANDHGQLGLASGPSASQTSPVVVASNGFGDAGPAFAPERVALGEKHGCALVASKEVLCWGRNDAGQLGDLVGGDRPPRLVPGLTNVTAIGARGSSTCAVGDFGLRCFGALALQAL